MQALNVHEKLVLSVMRAARKPLTAAEVKERMNAEFGRRFRPYDEREVRGHLKRLESLGKVKEQSDGQWVLL
jgi:repressor of nif and glnA expression